MKTCQFCKSQIARDAKKCPHCAEWLSDADRKANRSPSDKHAAEQQGVNAFASVALLLIILFFWALWHLMSDGIAAYK